MKIFVEGIADEVFLAHFIEDTFGIKPDRKSLFVKTGGYTNIEHNALPEFSLTTDQVNLVIFDADYPSNRGGYGIRKTYIEQVKAKFQIKFELFLYPNNSSDGDLETLLCDIISDEHRRIFECWDGFEDCISKAKKGYSIPARKSKVHTYLEVLHGNTNAEKEKCKEKNRNYLDNTIWNLKHPSLEELKKFLTPYFS